jgi:hypothetical protein
LLQGGCAVMGPFQNCACCGFGLGRDGECANPWCDLFASFDEVRIGAVAVAAGNMLPIPYVLEPLVEFCKPFEPAKCGHGKLFCEPCTECDDVPELNCHGDAV